VVDDHPSELELVENWGSMVDITLSNASDVQALYAMVEEVLDTARDREAGD
jgi:hypothetical protein